MELIQLTQEFEQLKQEFNLYKIRTNELSEYNSNSLPQDINKNLKILRNDIEDLKDYIDRLDHDYNKINKHDFNKMKDFYVKHIAKNLDLENEVINIKMTLHD